MNNAEDIDFDDLQGLVRFAHGHLTESCFLLLNVIDADSAREWLGAAPITSAATTSTLPEQSLQAAFTSAGLRALGVAESIIGEFSEEFIAGMSADENRSRRLGDVGSNSPAHWDWGGTGTGTPHLVLMLYASPGGLEKWVTQVRGEKFTDAFEILTGLHTAVRGPREPFGFVDGISQPTIDWQRRVSTDLHERDRYSNLLAVGEIVLGYPNEYGLYTARPLLDAGSTPGAQHLPVAEDQSELRDLGRNGTYLVLRQLAQDVPGFWQYVDGAADSVPEERERLAAAMVGRERDGKPLVPPTRKPIAGIDSKKENANANHFTFESDPHGLSCPIGAHIRRANPRTGDYPPGVRGLITRLIRTLGFGRRHPQDDLIASARFHRILRRGRAYGSTLPPEDAVKQGAPADERGLHFVAIGANIGRQFEFVQNAWSISAKFAGLATESDPLLGNREPLLNGDATDRFIMPQVRGPARHLSDLPRFVTVRGGAYFFMPGIRALQFIAGKAPEAKTE